MSAMADSADLISRLLKDAGLDEAAERVGDGMFRLKWGSATIMCVSSGDGVVAVAPIFEKPPEKNQLAFFRRLLELNAEIGGTAAFSVHKNGTVALQAGRTTQGLDAHELKIMLATVGKFADDYDDLLRDEFYK
jgi:hypothetical protein